MSAPQKFYLEGFVYKQTFAGVFKTWKRRWVEVNPEERNGFFYWHEDSLTNTVENAAGHEELVDFTIVRGAEEKGWHYFDIHFKQTDTIYNLSAPTEAERERWCSGLSRLQYRPSVGGAGTPSSPASPGRSPTGSPVPTFGSPGKKGTATVGYLRKKGVNAWQRFWAEVTPEARMMLWKEPLEENSPDNAQLSLDLSVATIEETHASARFYSFRIELPGKGPDASTAYQFCASTSAERERWCRNIRFLASLGKGPKPSSRGPLLGPPGRPLTPLFSRRCHSMVAIPQRYVTLGQFATATQKMTSQLDAFIVEVKGACKDRDSAGGKKAGSPSSDGDPAHSMEEGGIDMVLGWAQALAVAEHSHAKADKNVIKNVIDEIQQFASHAYNKPYLARLLLIIAPLSRVTDAMKDEESNEQLKKSKDMPQRFSSMEFVPVQAIDKDIEVEPLEPLAIPGRLAHHASQRSLASARSLGPISEEEGLTPNHVDDMSVTPPSGGSSKHSPVASPRLTRVPSFRRVGSMKELQTHHPRSARLAHGATSPFSPPGASSAGSSTTDPTSGLLALPGPTRQPSARTELEFVNEMASSMDTLTFHVGEYIVRRGDPGTAMYFITTGVVEVVFADGAVGAPKNPKMHEGEYFGEIALFLESQRTADVLAVSEVTVYVLTRDVSDQVISKYPLIEQQFIATGEARRKRKKTGDLPEQSMPWMGELSKKFLQKEEDALVNENEFVEAMGESMVLQHFTAGQSVFLKGDPGNSMYFVKKGTVEIVLPEGSNRANPKLTEGEFFGEIALFLDTLRTASVRCIGEVTLFMLAKDDCHRVFERFPLMRQQFINTAEARIHRDTRPPTLKEAAEGVAHHLLPVVDTTPAQPLSNNVLVRIASWVMRSKTSSPTLEIDVAPGPGSESDEEILASPTAVNTNAEPRTVCRICEQLIRTTVMEDHSRLCAISSKCGIKEFSCNMLLKKLIGDVWNTPGTGEAHHSVVNRLNAVAEQVQATSWDKEGSESLCIDQLSILRRLTTALEPRELMHSQSRDMANVARRLLEIEKQRATDGLRLVIEENGPEFGERGSLVDVCDTSHELYSFAMEMAKIIEEKLYAIRERRSVEGMMAQIVGRGQEVAGPSTPIVETKLPSIEDFDILKTISHGAYGAVLLARKKATGDLFAIKRLTKADVVRKNLVGSVFGERNIMAVTQSAFVVKLFYSFQSEKYLYLVMEYLIGGDLGNLLESFGCFSEPQARMFIAEIIQAVDYLHSKGVIHRDLKPDNIVLDAEGHIKLTDFGLSKIGLSVGLGDGGNPGSAYAMQGQYSTDYKVHPELQHVLDVAGTPHYLAPEVLLGTGHGEASDWWAVGVLLYEFLLGAPPFYGDSVDELFQEIIQGVVRWPEDEEAISPEARDLIAQLLTYSPEQRLGSGPGGVDAIKRHPFFFGLDWESLRSMPAMFTPRPADELDTAYFESEARGVRASLVPSDDGAETDVNTTNGTTEAEDETPSAESGTLAPPPTGDVFGNFSYKNLAELDRLNSVKRTASSLGNDSSMSSVDSSAVSGSFRGSIEPLPSLTE